MYPVDLKAKVQDHAYDTYWRSLPGPQTEVLKRREKEILYGGSRGPGKTEAGLAWMVEPEYLNNPLYKGLTVRVQYDDLKDWIDRARIFYAPLGATFSGNPVVIKFPSGARIRTGHLKDEHSFEKYLGHEYQKINIEELTLIPTEILYLKLISACRSTVPGLIPQVFCTTNPGNAGHLWVKKRFVDVAYKKCYWDEYGNTRIFIPAHVYDNPVLLKNDPGYVNFLRSIPDVNLRKAWLEGSWDVFFGQFFGKWNPTLHVIPEVPLPENVTRFLSIDYGVSAACSGLWGAMTDTGDLILYREYLEYDRPPSVAAQEIKYRCGNEYYNRILADPGMWGRQSEGVGKYKEGATMEGPAHIFIRNGLHLSKANNSRAEGWYKCKDMLYWDENRKPRFYVMDNCQQFIKNVAGAIYDELKTDDLKQSKGQGYHQDDLDNWRYMVMHTYANSKPKREQSFCVNSYDPHAADQEALWNDLMGEDKVTFPDYEAA